MAIRRLSPGRIKMHRTYLIEEAARTLGVHKNTVANWLKNGLEPIDNRRPILIQGRVLKAFLQERRTNRKRRCAVGELYCLKCRTPKMPLNGQAVYVPLTSSGGNLQARCPDCLSIICRRTSLSQIDHFSTVLSMTHKQASPRINDRSAPSLKCELGDN
jgi:hypothetical protein